MTAGADFQKGINDIIKLLGCTMTFTKPDGTGVRTQRAAIVSIGREDAALVNALGVEARVIYIKPMTPPPVKLDKVTSQTGHDYTIRFIHEILVDNQMVGYKLGVTG